MITERFPKEEVLDDDSNSVKELKGPVHTTWNIFSKLASFMSPKT